MTDRPVLGLMLALLVESPRWTKFRWDFNEAACGRAWQLTTIAIALAAVLIYLDGSPYLALPNLLTWLPPLLLPMQFVQSFGLNDSLPLNTFSFLAKHRRKRNLRLGLSEPVIQLNFGNVYFITVLVASTLGSQANSWPFLPGTIVLTGWMLLSASRSRPLSLAVALTVAGGIAVAGQVALKELENRFGNSAPGRARFDPDSVFTLIGRPGQVVQSPDIVWRLRPAENTVPPRLLRAATYNAYRVGGVWVSRPAGESEFKDLVSLLFEGEPYSILARDSGAGAQSGATAKDLPRYNLRGAAFAETPLPLPGDAASLRDFELDGIQCNSLGTVRVFPKHSVIDGTVLWNGGSDPENPPLKADLTVPAPEKDALLAVLKELRLDQHPSLREKLGIIRTWFQRDFSYTRKLTIRFNLSTGPTPLAQFLSTTRSGHCEYFATAAVLLLREAGIPARYATGHAVIERDVKRKEFVIRGTHGHAWCRVWDDSSRRWIDFDTTPAGGLETTLPRNPSMQRFNDAVRCLREDFFLWRNRPENRLAVSLVMSAIGLGVIGFIVKKLWSSKRRLEAAEKSTGYEGPVIRTPLHALEQQAAKHLGSRPPGQPFAAWLLGLRPTLADSSALDEAIELHQRLRFDPAPPAQTQQDRLAELAGQLATALKRR